MIESLDMDYGGDMTLRYISFKSRGEFDDFREKMLLHNSISGYLQLNVVHVADEKSYRYDISDKKSLREVLAEKCITEDGLLGLLKELESIFIKGKSYMFEEWNYILHPDAIYYSPEGKVYVCYLPGYEKDVQGQLCDLLEFLMNCVDVTDRRSVYAVYSTYVAARDGNCTFGSLINLMESNLKNLSIVEQTLLKENRKVTAEVGEETAELSFWQKLVNLREKEKRQLGYAALTLGFAFVVLYFIFS